MNSDWGTRFVVLIFGVIPGSIIAAYLIYLFVSVVYFGGGDACPQNLC